MSGPRLRRLGLVLLLAVGTLSSGPAIAQDPDDFDVIIVVDEGAVTYNGDSIEGMSDLEQALAEDVEADPELTVELVARDTVPFAYVLQIMEKIRQYDVSCKLEFVSQSFENDDNM
jgi:biopolymer transport protein ExbD